MTAADHLLQAEWARALYIGWAKYGDSPLFDATVRDLGINPLSVQWRAELAAS